MDPDPMNPMRPMGGGDEAELDEGMGLADDAMALDEGMGLADDVMALAERLRGEREALFLRYSAIVRRGLRPEAEQVLAYLFACSDELGWLMLDHEEAREALGLAEPELRRQLAALGKHGSVRLVSREGGTSTYKLLRRSDFETWWARSLQSLRPERPLHWTASIAVGSDAYLVGP